MSHKNCKVDPDAWGLSKAAESATTVAAIPQGYPHTPCTQLESICHLDPSADEMAR